MSSGHGWRGIVSLKLANAALHKAHHFKTISTEFQALLGELPGVRPGMLPGPSGEFQFATCYFARGTMFRQTGQERNPWSLKLRLMWMFRTEGVLVTIAPTKCQGVVTKWAPLQGLLFNHDPVDGVLLHELWDENIFASFFRKWSPKRRVNANGSTCALAVTHCLCP